MKPSFRFGAFTDLHLTTEITSSIALQALKRCVKLFNSIQLDFVIQLGDIVASGDGATEIALQELGNIRYPLYSAIGNHDFDIAEHEKERFFGTLFPKGTYYDFSPCPHWRCIVLDGTEVSVFRYSEQSRERLEASDLLRKLKSENAGRAFEWNGAIGSRQIEWLSERLDFAEMAREMVIIFCHFPCYPSDELFSLLNAPIILALIEAHNCVIAYVSGHQHPGFYKYRKGTHYVSLRSIGETSKHNCTTFEIIDSKINIIGINEHETMLLEF